MAAGWSIGGSLGGWMTDSMISNATVLNVGQYSAGPSMTGSVPAGRVGGANAPLVSKTEFVQQNQPPVEEAGVIVQEGTGIFAPPTAVLGEGIGPMVGGYTAPVTTMDNMSLSAGDYIGTGGQVNAPLNYNAPLTSIGTAASNPASAPTGVGTVNTTIPSYTYTSPVITNNTGINNMSLEGDVTPKTTEKASTTEKPVGLVITPPEKQEVPTIKSETNLAGKVDDLEIKKLEAGEGVAAPTAVTTAPITTTEGTATEAVLPTQVTAAGYEAKKAGETAPTEAAIGVVSPEAVAKVEEQKALTKEAVAAGRDLAAEEAAKGVAATRPEAKEYMKAITTDEAFKIIEAEEPEVATRIAQTMDERQQKDILSIVSTEGVDLTTIPEFNLAEKRIAQTGEAKTRIAQELGDVPSLDFTGREAITGNISQGDAAQIGGVPTLEASTRQAVTGAERNVGAADMMAVVANVPKEVTAAISEDPTKVETAIDSGEVPNLVAAVAALPQEALVSVQMEQLLAGMEEGKTPAWARPAIAAIESQMAQRGLTASTVGRDALFNAIIQSALPIAQSNAQALQQRAAQNLSNEQQANLATAQNTMTIRMQNLANTQTAASQTAQMANEIKLQQGSFKQQAVITTAEQAQQTALSNAKMAQEKAQQESSQKQQAAIATLSANAQMDLANLQALNAAGAENLSAEQQTKLTAYNAQVSRIVRQAELKQDMEKANLSAELQVELSNLTEKNAAARETMTAENQERLTNLNTLVEFKKTNVELAQQMELANLNNEQQMELANLSERATADSANFTTDNQFRLQRLTIYTNMMAKNEDLRQNAEMARLSASEKINLANLTFQNQADAESMSAENVAELQVYEKKMQAGQVNAQLAQAMGLTKLSNKQEAAMFNAQINGNLDMKQMDANQQMAIANSQFMQTMTQTKFSADQQAAMQNAAAMASMDMANLDQRTKLAVTNAQSFLAMDMANLNNNQQAIILDQQMEQQRILSDQAAVNAALQFNAASEDDVNKFMASLASNMQQFNAAQTTAMSQFNATEKNRIAAIEAGNDIEVQKFNEQLITQINQFNDANELQRDQWNAANEQAVANSNIEWRRQANTIDTAALNASNQLSAQMAYNIGTTEQANLWQTLRDEANYLRQAYENEEQRKATLYATALANEGASAASGGSQKLMDLATTFFTKLGGA